MLYVNAGHQPPLHFSGEKTVELAKGGTVIGPLAESRFKRGFARLLPEDVLVMCTDGILERRGKGGEFGDEALRRVVKRARKAGAQEILDQIFTKSFDHGEGRPWEDDATVVVVRRLPANPP
jgi:serine phosphatase RsbU (regulator of sigma subunit)